MRTGTRITRKNIHLLADEVGVSAKDLYDDMVDAKLALKREQDKKWSYGFFRKDERWYDDTMQKIQDIRESLADDINPKEATIKMYGWIEKNGKKNLSMPMMSDKDYPVYAYAAAVEFILTNPDSYHKMMNWD